MINEAAQWTTIAILASYVAKNYYTKMKMLISHTEQIESLNRTCGYLLEMIKDLRRAYGK